ncbi:hypothetical protein [Nocardioides currus]|uniref:Uncharacterized protein n=1 Tax=Nocardioides currus TaxID=2133958 RepID=A0A2R7YR96_9ACTN|nr:hypothetical protein [Nocardioides currus]PUA78935.1 hypothetical protein C7S10_21780 [Nocardioides currus]
MEEPGSLLATLAQSSAAVVAIVGGFLVSRLVQLSSEREGLRRQMVHALDELAHVSKDLQEAHEYRLHNSQRTFKEWVLEALVASDPDTLDRESIVADNIPRGSSAEEMADYIDDLLRIIQQAKADIARYTRDGDDAGLEIDHLRARGLVVPDGQGEVYDEVVSWVGTQLPASRYVLGVSMAALRPFDAAGHATDMRRLDESIRDEQNLYSRKLVLDATRSRLATEIERIGRPTGVLSAIGILAIYSVLGIVAPVVVMSVDPEELHEWQKWGLVGAFIGGLFAVLGYIWWYATTLNDPLPTAPAEAKVQRPIGGARHADP